MKEFRKINSSREKVNIIKRRRAICTSFNQYSNLVYLLCQFYSLGNETLFIEITILSCDSLLW